MNPIKSCAEVSPEKPAVRQTPHLSQARSKHLSPGAALGFSAVAVACFHLAYARIGCEPLIAGFLYAMLRLANLGSSRQAFYFGLSIGLAIYAPHLTFFWTIFKGGALLLWSVLAFWLGIFLVLARACLRRAGPAGLACTAPFIWTGIEFFRSELYWLKFSWLNIGYSFSESAHLVQLAQLGVYGVGFAAMIVAAAFYLFPFIPRIVGSSLVLTVCALVIWLGARAPSFGSGQNTLRVAGMQLEFPGVYDALAGLNRLIQRWPNADLLVLSEYTFDGPVPDLIKRWCRTNHKHLILGAKDQITSQQFYNTAFVINTEGEIVFSQVKSVPIQFFKDGLPAREQKLWHSPWGALGLAVCYDASYTRVMDELVRQGAQALILPTMDVAEWGEYQHNLHARVAPLRAAEYGIPIFRVCSSGISQVVDRSGGILSAAPFPGQYSMLSGTITLPRNGRIPPDRALARLCVCLFAVLSCYFAFSGIRERRKRALEPVFPKAVQSLE